MTKKKFCYWVIVDSLYEAPKVCWETRSKTRRGSIQEFDSEILSNGVVIGESVNCYKNLKRRGITKCVKFEVTF